MQKSGISCRLAGSLVWIILAAPATLLAEGPAEIQCIERAKDQSLLQEAERERLCLGTRGLQPIECFRAAVDEPALDKPEAIDLCRCATSTEPVRCFREALNARPDEPLWAVRQCSPISTQKLTADCRPLVPMEPGSR
jgi:hypothetical protein